MNNPSVFIGGPIKYTVSILVILLVASNLFAQTSDTALYHAEDVHYEAGSITLAALLMLPQSQKAMPAVVIIQGSGASDRSNQWSRDIAEVLVANGVAVLLTDKRGSGASEGDWRVAGMSDLANDALAGVEFLRSRIEVDPSGIGLVGLSQGGWVAPLAAARSKRVKFVINISGATVTFAEQTFTEMANTSRQAGLSEESVMEVLELNRRAVEFLTTGDWEQYANARKRGLQAPWHKVASGFPESPELPIWTFLRKVIFFDPLPYWIQFTGPVLVIYGAEDEHDNVPVTESVRRLNHTFRAVGKTNYEIKVIANAGHGFLNHQRNELMKSFVETLSSWVETHVKKDQ